MAESLDRLGSCMTEAIKSVSLGDVSTVITSGSRGWARYYAGDGSPFIRMTNLRRDGIALDLEDLRYVSLPENSVEAKRTKLKKNDILVSITAELGKIGFVRNLFESDAFISQHVCLVRLESPEIDNEYAAYLLSSAPERRRLNRLNDAGAKAGLNLRAIARYRLTFPPLSEQRKIAEILRTWDEAIEKLETLNDRLERQSAAIYNRIFESDYTANDRLLRAREVFEIVSERKRTDLPLLAVMQDIGIVRREELDRRVVMPEGDISGYKVVRPGDFVISLRSFEGGLEYSTVTGLVSPAYTVLRPSRKIENAYYRHFFKSRSFISRLDKLIFGIRDGKQIAFRDFGHMLIPNPLISDQRKRATLLDAAAELVVANKHRKKALECQKRGLMQKLLTGEWRVKVERGNSFEAKKTTDERVT